MAPAPEHWVIAVWPFDGSPRSPWLVRAFGQRTGAVVPVAGPRSFTSLAAARSRAREMLPNFSTRGGSQYEPDTAEIRESRAPAPAARTTPP